MSEILLRGGQAAGVLGILLMVIAVLTRLSGRYVLAGFETGSLLQGGTAAIGVACFAFLWLLVERSRR